MKSPFMRLITRIKNKAREQLRLIEARREERGLRSAYFRTREAMRFKNGCLST
jgi:hypothetical protein